MAPSELTVGLDEVAKAAGVPPHHVFKAIYDLLDAGRLTDALDIGAQVDLCDWIDREALLDGDPFHVVLKISQNRKKDAAVHCLCRVDMGGDEPLIRVRHEVGVEDAVPSFCAGLKRHTVAMRHIEFDYEPARLFERTSTHGKKG